MPTEHSHPYPQPGAHPQAPGAAPASAQAHGHADARADGAAPTPWAMHLAVWAGGLLVVAAPLIRGGNRHLALLVLEWLALLVLLALVWAQLARPQPSARPRWERASLWLLASSPLWVGALQLLPLPLAVWQALPGRADYAQALQAMGLALPTHWPASLTPDATLVSVLAALPLLACLGLALAAPAAAWRALLRVWVAVALAQAVLGLAQLGPYEQLQFGAEFQGVIGTFANRNHLGNFLVMTLPLVWVELQSAWWRAQRGQTMATVWAWALVLVVLLSTVLAGGSRGAIGTAVLALGAAVLLIPGPAGVLARGRERLAAFAALLLLSAAAAGTGWMAGFAGERLLLDAGVRASIRQATWEAAQVFWPLGSGLGSYATVFPRFQPPAVVGWVEHAHSDYVQLLMEGGAPGLLAMAAALALAGGRGLRLARQAQQGLGSAERMALACGLGLLALLLHAWVEFNWHIPANAMLGAFLFGSWLRQAPAVKSARRVRARRAAVGDNPD